MHCSKSLQIATHMNFAAAQHCKDHEKDMDSLACQQAPATPPTRSISPGQLHWRRSRW